MSRIVITGAGGFLGSNLVKTLSEKEIFDEIVGITLGAKEMRSRIPEQDGLRIYEADAIKKEEVRLSSEDIVLNCAYPRSVKDTDVAGGLDYVESVFQAAAEARVQGIANVSSQSVYDPKRDHPAKETDVPVLCDGYAIGKYCMEILLRNICKDIPYTNIRLASLIGPGFDARVVNKLVKIALREHRIVVQDNQQNFGYLDVQDAVRGLCGLVSMDVKDWKPLYNLGAQRTTTLVEIARCIADVFEKEYGLAIKVETASGDGFLNTALDSGLLIKDIGECREMSLKDSVEMIIKGTVSA